MKQDTKKTVLKNTTARRLNIEYVREILAGLAWTG
jgi:hypothetical protein